MLDKIIAVSHVMAVVVIILVIVVKMTAISPLHRHDGAVIGLMMAVRTVW